MRWKDALGLLIRQRASGPVVTDYLLARLLWQLGKGSQIAGREVTLPASGVSRALYRRARSAVVDTGVLVEDPALPPSALRVPGPKAVDAELVMGCLDPFGCVAFESAMVHHGLTNRLPRVLYWKSLDSVSWREAAKARMREELGDQWEEFMNIGLPVLRPVAIERWGGLRIEVIRSRRAQSGWRWLGDTGLRVTSLGRTFLDMFQRPELCGGMRHVIEIFESKATTYLELIVAEFDRNGTKLDRARAGYLLEERCGKSHPLLDAWASQAQRGGSRLLDPAAEYVPSYSQRWCLSVND